MLHKFKVRDVKIKNAAHMNQSWYMITLTYLRATEALFGPINWFDD